MREHERRERERELFIHTIGLLWESTREEREREREKERDREKEQFVYSRSTVRENERSETER